MSLVFVFASALVLFPAEMLLGKRPVVCHDRPLRYNLLRFAQAVLNTATTGIGGWIGFLLGRAALLSANEGRWGVFALAAGFLLGMILLCAAPARRVGRYLWTPLLYPHQRLWPFEKRAPEEERRRIAEGFQLTRAVALVLGIGGLLGVKLSLGQWSSVSELLALAVVAATWSHWLAVAIDERVNPRPFYILAQPAFFLGLAAVLAAICALGHGKGPEALLSERPALAALSFFGAVGMIVPLIERLMNLGELPEEFANALRALRRAAPPQ